MAANWGRHVARVQVAQLVRVRVQVPTQALGVPCASASSSAPGSSYSTASFGGRTLSQASFSLGPCSTSRRSFSSSQRDPYKVLGVERSATEKDIKAAYRRLALKHHPDRQEDPGKRDEAASKFSELTEAYETLSDPDKRRNFDAGMNNPNFRGDIRGNMGQRRMSQDEVERLFTQAFAGIDMRSFMGDFMQSPTNAKVGMRVKVMSDAGTVLSACRRSQIDSTNDGLRMKSLGRRGRIVKVDPKDQSMKVAVEGVGDVWFGSGAVAVDGQGLPGGFEIFNFGTGMGGMGGMGGLGGAGQAGVVKMSQKQVMKDGKRVTQVTKVIRNPDGSMREEIEYFA